ncbi:protocadherin alpha-C2-like [Protopterus annectens]|uniref:protocadherin alpha-C2-like n=1 Tax=Protopterus annectens TaxID=7888 RepID=UPI001CFB4DA8|nr:protocadherin alpha-C2-like [Protopterus annectens]
MSPDERNNGVHWGELLLSIVLSSFLDICRGDILFSVPEELQPGTLVGNIENSFGLRVINGSDHQFRFVSGDSKQPLFTTSVSGDIFVNDRIDRETLCGIKMPCYVNMKLIMNNPLEMHSVKLEIEDINDNAPAFPFTDLQLSVLESVRLGTTFTLQIAHDPDVGSNGLQSYHLNPSGYFSFDFQHSDDRVNVPQLVLEQHLDRERESVHHLALIAVDGGQPVRSGTLNITINVLDANDNAPTFVQSTYKTSLNEDAPIGTLIIQLRATDLDEGANGAIEYSFSSHTPDNIRSLFHIHPTTGQIRLKNTLDVEEASRYELHVQATDRGPSALSDYCKVLLDIIDVNNNRPTILLTSVANSISESAPSGTVVALISLSDKDSGMNAYVNCKIPDNIPFTLRKVEDYYTLETNSPLDRESVARYNVSVIATDSGIPPLSTETFIFIQVQDINDNPPQFTEISYKCFIAENNYPGDRLCQVTAIDPDLEENCTLTYSIADENIHNVSVFNYVSVDFESGHVYARTIFDYEKIKELEIQVIAKDQGNPSLNSTAKLTISIIDQNDNSPIFLHPPVSVGNVPIEMIPRSAEAGFLVTKVITVDEDSGQNAWLSYQLLQSTDSLFDIDKQTGEIRIVRSISAKDNSRQKLVVEVKDNGIPRQSATVTIGLLLYDNFPPLLPDFGDLVENKEKVSNTNIVLIISVIAISFLFLGVLIISVSLTCCKSTNYDRRSCPPACCADDFDTYKLQIPGHPDCTLQNNLLQIADTGTLLHGYNYMAFLGQVSPSKKIFLNKTHLESIVNNPIGATQYNIPIQKNDAESDALLMIKPLKTFSVELHGPKGHLFCFTNYKKQFIGLVVISQNIRFFPSRGDIIFFIPEELQPGTLVGKEENNLGLAIRNVSGHQFRLVSGDNKQHLFVSENGDIFVQERIDREIMYDT